jgi:hypothetical protein
MWADFEETSFFMELELLGVNNQRLPQSYIDDL